MKLIVGLGNPGEKYQNTRHNMGFMVLDELLKDYEKVEKTVWNNEPKFKSDIARINWKKKDALIEKVILAKPKTYMNNSGLAVSLISKYLNILISDIWIIHDDIDLPLGSIRIRFGGSSGGHRGIESLIEDLKTEKFWRYRLGTWGKVEIDRGTEGHKKIKLKHVEDFVLSNFEKDEAAKARDLARKGAKAVEMALNEGLEKAMNRYNTK